MEECGITRRANAQSTHSQNRKILSCFSNCHVTLRKGRGHLNRHECVKLERGHRHAQYQISYSNSIRENTNGNICYLNSVQARVNIKILLLQEKEKNTATSQNVQCNLYAGFNPSILQSHNVFSLTRPHLVS